MGRRKKQRILTSKEKLVENIIHEIDQLSIFPINEHKQKKMQEYSKSAIISVKKMFAITMGIDDDF